MHRHVQRHPRTSKLMYTHAHTVTNALNTQCTHINTHTHTHIHIHTHVDTDTNMRAYDSSLGIILHILNRLTHTQTHASTHKYTHKHTQPPPTHTHVHLL